MVLCLHLLISFQVDNFILCVRECIRPFFCIYSCRREFAFVENGGDSTLCIEDESKDRGSSDPLLILLWNELFKESLALMDDSEAVDLDCRYKRYCRARSSFSLIDMASTFSWMCCSSVTSFGSSANDIGLETEDNRFLFLEFTKGIIVDR